MGVSVKRKEPVDTPVQQVTITSTVGKEYHVRAFGAHHGSVTWDWGPSACPNPDGGQFRSKAKDVREFAQLLLVLADQSEGIG